MALDDRRQRLDHRLDPLAGRDQPEGREQEPLVAAVVRRPSARPSAADAIAARRASTGGAPCGTTRTLLAGHVSAVDEQALRGLGHHDHELGLAAERGEHLSLMRRRLREHRVQRHDERLRQLLDEREDVLAVGAAEDPVLVLEQDDVDIEPAEDPRGADVVAANRLRDRRHEPRPLRAGRLVDDHDLLDAVDPVDAEQRCRGRRPQRCRSRTHAADRWRRSRCARLPAPFRRDSGAAPRRQRSRFAVSVAVLRPTRPASRIGGTVLGRIRPETTEALHPSSSSTTWPERCREFVRIPCPVR